MRSNKIVIPVLTVATLCSYTYSRQIKDKEILSNRRNAERSKGNNYGKADIKLKITVGNTAVTATLYDNATTRSFVSQLPLTVKMNEYADRERYFNPPNGLSISGAKEGYAPKEGDITYYSPLKGIAVFYKNSNYLAGLVPLGTIDNNEIKVFKRTGNMTAKFEIQ